MKVDEIHLRIYWQDPIPVFTDSIYSEMVSSNSSGVGDSQDSECARVLWVVFVPFRYLRSLERIYAGLVQTQIEKVEAKTRL